MRFLSKVRTAVVLAGMVAFAPAAVMAEGSPELVRCFNDNSGREMVFPRQVAEHLDGRGGWWCKM